MTINHYLNFPGNTEDAFNFYKSVSGGGFSLLQRFKNMPDGDNITSAFTPAAGTKLPVYSKNFQVPVPLKWNCRICFGVLIMDRCR